MHRALQHCCPSAARRFSRVGRSHSECSAQLFASLALWAMIRLCWLQQALQAAAVPETDDEDDPNDSDFELDLEEMVADAAAAAGPLGSDQEVHCRVFS